MQEVVDDMISLSIDSTDLQFEERQDIVLEDDQYVIPDDIPDHTVHNKKCLGPDTEQWQFYEESEDNVNSYYKAICKYMVWAIARFTSGINKQKVPAFGGFVSKTGNVPKRLTTIDYYPMIHAPFTEYSTMKEILSVVGSATREVQQDPPYPITTMDLGGVNKNDAGDLE